MARLVSVSTEPIRGPNVTVFQIDAKKDTVTYMVNAAGQLLVRVPPSGAVADGTPRNGRCRRSNP
jgi:hypothetical protein